MPGGRQRPRGPGPIDGVELVERARDGPGQCARHWHVVTANAGASHLSVTAAGEHDATSVWSAVQAVAEQPHWLSEFAQQCPEAGGEHVCTGVRPPPPHSTAQSHDQAPDTWYLLQLVVSSSWQVQNVVAPVASVVAQQWEGRPMLCGEHAPFLDEAVVHWHPSSPVVAGAHVRTPAGAGPSPAPPPEPSMGAPWGTQAQPAARATSTPHHPIRFVTIVSFPTWPGAGRRSPCTADRAVRLPLQDDKRKEKVGNPRALAHVKPLVGWFGRGVWRTLGGLMLQRGHCSRCSGRSSALGGLVVSPAMPAMPGRAGATPARSQQPDAGRLSTSATRLLPPNLPLHRTNEPSTRAVRGCSARR